MFHHLLTALALQYELDTRKSVHMFQDSSGWLYNYDCVHRMYSSLLCALPLLV